MDSSQNRSQDQTTKKKIGDARRYNSDSSYKEGYNHGHYDGKIDGENAGYEAGYSDGHEAGYSDGRNDAYSDGYGMLKDKIERMETQLSQNSVQLTQNSVQLTQNSVQLTNVKSLLSNGNNGSVNPGNSPVQQRSSRKEDIWSDSARSGKGSSFVDQVRAAGGKIPAENSDSADILRFGHQTQTQQSNSLYPNLGYPEPTYPYPNTNSTPYPQQNLTPYFCVYYKLNNGIRQNNGTYTLDVIPAGSNNPRELATLDYTNQIAKRYWGQGSNSINVTINEEALCVRSDRPVLDSDGLFFMDLQHPNLTLEQYVQQRIAQAFADQEKKQEELKLQREQEQKREQERAAAEKAKREADEQARKIAEMKQQTSMARYFDIVRKLQQEPSPEYLNFDGYRFNYTSVPAAEYILWRENGKLIVLPNKTEEFAANRLSKYVYEFSGSIIDESFSLVQPCIVDSQDAIIQCGKIERQ